MQLIYLRASNDSEGNPRRSWILLNDNGIAVDCFDEGYSGTAAVPAKFKHERLTAPSIHVAVRELNAWRKTAKQNRERINRARIGALT
jgi:hypothetical protein